jgi:YD repeat-containing protein
LLSNDIVGATRWPDPSTGAASSGQQDSVTVNSLGQTLTSTDRNGTVHSFGYDVLGRVVYDAVTTLDSGIDGTVTCAFLTQHIERPVMLYIVSCIAILTAVHNANDTSLKVAAATISVTGICDGWQYACIVASALLRDNTDPYVLAAIANHTDNRKAWILVRKHTELRSDPVLLLYILWKSPIDDYTRDTLDLVVFVLHRSPDKQVLLSSLGSSGETTLALDILVLFSYLHKQNDCYFSVETATYYSRSVLHNVLFSNTGFVWYTTAVDKQSILAAGRLLIYKAALDEKLVGAIGVRLQSVDEEISIQACSIIRLGPKVARPLLPVLRLRLQRSTGELRLSIQECIDAILLDEVAK